MQTLMRPNWPDATDSPRVVHTAARLALLEGDWEKYLGEFLGRVQGEARTAALGVLDTAWNLLASYCRQMSTPGLYGRRPTIHSPPGAEWLTGVGGMLDRALWSPAGIRLEYWTRGLGDMLLCVHVDPVHGLQLRPVYPHDVYVRWDPDSPGRAVDLRELRMRRRRGDWIWTWDVYSLADMEQPAFWIEEADARGGRVTDAFLADAPADGLIGDAYPWRYADGRPYIRYVHYQASVGGGYWSWRDGVGLHRGTFQAARLSNTALYAADAAAMPVTVIIDGDIKGINVRNDGQASALKTLELTPGGFFRVLSMGDKAATVQSISGSADAVALGALVRNYSMSILAQHGLRGEDASRDQANPTSAAALSIQDASRREGQRQLRDLFAPADLELIAMTAAQAAAVGLGQAPETGHEIEYHLIPESSAEREARQAEEEFELSNGLVSRVQLYMRRHGVTRDAAIRALKEIAADEAAIATPSPTPTV